MSARRFAAIALLLALPVFGVAEGARPAPVARRAATAKLLPPGPGRAIAQSRCLVCHSAMLLTQQHKDSTGWDRTLQQMEKWGSGSSGRDTLLGYLVAHFGPRPAKPAR